MNLKQRYDAVFQWFKNNYGILDTELQYNTPFQLLVAVMLSAQCTDKRVNATLPSLFQKYPTPYHMAKANIDDIKELIRSISYPNSKAEHLSLTAKRIVNDFNGEVPKNPDDLLSLPGVGRKTANVVRSILWKEPVMGVDTHILRVANRIGLVHNANTPIKTEKQLTTHIPPALFPLAHHWLIHHGRYTCKALHPLCNECGINKFCLSKKNISKINPNNDKDNASDS